MNDSRSPKPNRAKASRRGGPTRKSESVVRAEPPSIQQVGRYELTTRLGGSDRTEVWLGRDVVTGRAVVVKSGECRVVAHEARCLLALPPVTGPRLLDIRGEPSGRASLILELIKGQALASAQLPQSLVPGLAQAVCQALVHIHRAGWIHGDISPRNILVQATAAPASFRLVDFGCAIDRYGAPDEDLRGGTPPFVAPELAQGWILDGRADLYSLGVLLRELFRGLSRQRRWSPILSRLYATYPADRYPNAAAARDAIARAFRLPASLDRFPRFGAGAVCGRDRDLARSVAALRRRGARILVQALPGAGLTRFLLEAARRGIQAGRPVRVIDLPKLGLQSDASCAYLEACLASGEPVIAGINDPSPGLRWVSGPNRDRLRGLLSDSRWVRVSLSPVGDHDMADMVFAGLGSRDPAVELLAGSLAVRAEGNLRAAGEVFEACVRQCAKEDGARVQLDPGKLTRWLRKAAPAGQDHLVVPVPDRLVPPLRTCAIAGTSLPQRTARSLLQRFHPPGTRAELLDHGLLFPTDPGRLRFVTRGLWSRAMSPPAEGQADVDRWLHEHAIPNPAQVGDTIAAAARARRLNDLSAESAYLARAIDDADRHRRWRDALALLVYPGDLPARWTQSLMMRRARWLSRILPSRWTVERLVALAGTCLHAAHEPCGIALLEQAAGGDDPGGKAAALIVLADHWVRRPDRTNFDRCLAALRSSDAAAPGVPEFFVARRLALENQSRRATPVAQRAARMLRGSGNICEALSNQLLGTLQFPVQPNAGVRAMKHVPVRTADAELAAQAAHNLARMYGLLGRPADTIAVADQALIEGANRISRDRVLGLRVQRAWGWANTDQLDRARGEILALLQLPVVRTAAIHDVPARLLLGFCTLHQGRTDQAVGIHTGVWRDASQTVPALAYQCLPYLVDAVLDATAWDIVSALGSSLASRAPSGDADYELAWARAGALTALAEGRRSDALTILEQQRWQVRRPAARISAARYLHQYACTLMSAASAEVPPPDARRAVARLRDELRILPPTGYAYDRARALLLLAEALRSCGRSSESARILSRAIALARRHECQALLARGLAWRAQNA